jgi:hypothetical protein
VRIVEPIRFQITTTTAAVTLPVVLHSTPAQVVAEWSDGTKSFGTTLTNDFGSVADRTHWIHLHSAGKIREINWNTKDLKNDFPDISGLTNLVNFNCGANQLTGNIPDISGLTNLVNFHCYVNQLTGNIPDISGLVNIITFHCAVNQFTGSIPAIPQGIVYFYCHINQLTGNIPAIPQGIVYFYCYTNQFTGYISAGAMPLTLINFQAQTNQLSESAVNQILADFASNLASRPSTGTLNIGGTGNAAPTGQGLTDKSAIIAHGWTVTTN